MTAADPDARRAALHALVGVYWRPVYVHFRIHWAREPADAEDLTQEFFAAAVAGDFFAGFEPERARFRTFVRVCCDRFAAKARRAERRLKRGGGAVHLPLDFVGVEQELGRVADAAKEDAETRFEREWVRSLFEVAVEALRQESQRDGHEVRFAVFERYDLAPDDATRPTYRELGQALGLPTTQVTNHLAWARRALRRLVLENVRALCVSDEEYRAEARALFGREGG